MKVLPRTRFRIPSATLSPSTVFLGSPVMRLPCFRHLSWRDEEGFSSCSICPCHRTVPTTPPECHVASVSPRHAMLPSPRSRGLGLRIFILFRGHLWVYFRYGPVTRSPSLRWLCRSASSASLSFADTTQASLLFLNALLRQNSICTENSAIPCRDRCPIGVIPSSPERQDSLPGEPPRRVPIYI